MDESDEDENEEILVDDFIVSEVILDTAIKNATLLSSSSLCTSPLRTSAFTGAEYTRELLSCGHDGRIKELLRMKKSTFDSLLSWALSRNLLREKKYITHEEAFFYVLNGFHSRSFKSCYTRTISTQW
jgi:hypothetical protein